MLDDIFLAHDAESHAAAHATTLMPQGSGTTRIVASSFLAEQQSDDIPFMAHNYPDGGHVHASFFVDKSSADALKQGQIAEFQAAEATNLARGALKDSSRAARQALSAAKVAAFTQMVCLLGSIGGLLNAYVGFKMDDDELPAPVKNALQMHEE